MSQYRYQCTTAGSFYNGKPYREGEIIIISASTAPTGFTVYDGDIYHEYCNFTIDLDGTIHVDKRAGMWDDMRFPATRVRQGALSKPDFDYTNIGLLFPNNAATEKVYMNRAISHSYKFNSPMYPHVHYVQDEAEVPVFKLDYRVYSGGGDPTVALTTIATTGLVYEYVSGSVMQIAVFPPITPTGITGTDNLFDGVLYRDDAIVAGDVLVKEFDIHFNSDTLGSGGMFKK